MNLSRIRLAAGLVACLIVFASPTTEARKKTPLVENGQGMEDHIFRSAVDTKGHFTVDTTPVLPHLAFSVGLIKYNFSQLP